MGNAPSAEVRDQYRLSKPKTFAVPLSNSPSSTPIKGRQPALSPTFQPRLAEQEVVVQTACGTSRSKESAREQVKSHLFGPERGTSEDEVDDDKLGELATRINRALERSGSFRTKIPSARSSSSRVNLKMNDSQTSLSSSTKAIDLKETIGILQELKKTASPEDILSLQRALSLGIEDDVSPVSPSSQSDENADVAAKLMRRRSLAVPGLATRLSEKKLPDCQVELPSPRQQLKNEMWKPEMFRPSPLTRLSSLDLERDEENPEVPRAQTPGEMDYSHLGSWKPGTLMVMNGPASPSPSVRSRPLTGKNRSLDIGREEEYFTTSDGYTLAPADVRPRSMGGKPAARQKNPHHDMPSLRVGRSRVPQGNSRSRNGSPLKREITPAPSDVPVASSRGPSYEHVSPYVSALSLADEYKSEIMPSPYESKFPALGQEAGITRDVDEGYVGETEHETTAEDEAYRILNRLDDCGETDFTLNVPSFLEKQRPIQVKKSDSGYSSTGSTSNGRYPLLRTRSRSSGPRLTDEWRSENRSGNVVSPGGRGRRLSQQFCFVPSAEPTPIYEASQPFQEPAIEAENRPRMKSRRKSFFGKSKSEGTTPEVTPAKSEKSVVDTPDKTSTPRRKLQKRRPKSMANLKMPANRPIEDGSIPSVPSSVSTKFSNRLSMLNLERGLLSDSSLSSPNPGSPLEKIPILAPSVDNLSDISEKSPDADRRPPIPPPHRYLGRRRSNSQASRRANESIAGIADFGMVADSLGGSPYDVAGAAFPRRTPGANVHHPYEMGAPRPQYMRSITMYDNAAAPARGSLPSAFPRNHSYVEEHRRRPISSLAAPLSQPQIMSGDVQHRVGMIEQRCVRPEYVQGDLPLLSSQQYAKIETPPRHRPQSLFAGPSPVSNASSTPPGRASHPRLDAELRPEKRMSQPAYFPRSSPGAPDSRGWPLANDINGPADVKPQQFALKEDLTSPPLADSPTLPRLGWEMQQKAWRDRRKSAQAGLQPKTTSYTTTSMTTTTTMCYGADGNVSVQSWIA